MSLIKCNVYSLIVYASAERYRNEIVTLKGDIERDLRTVENRSR